MALHGELHYLDGKVKKKGAHPFTLMSHNSDIWLGEFVDPNRTPSAIVIKLIRNTMSAADMQKLQMKLFREAKLWATLSHPNVVPLLGVTTAIEIAPTPGLVTPYYKNGSLKKYIFDEKRTLDLNDKMSLLYQVADALDYLHSQKPAVIHGDIKPENVLIDDHGQAVLSDFGLAVILGASGFTTKHCHGTIHYLAPELLLANGSAVRPALETDVWGFGILATEIFSKREPYGVDRDTVVLQKVTKERHTLKHEDYPEIRAGLWSGLMACWKWEPADRITINTLKMFIKDKQDDYAAEKGPSRATR